MPPFAVPMVKLTPMSANLTAKRDTSSTWAHSKAAPATKYNTNHASAQLTIFPCVAQMAKLMETSVHLTVNKTTLSTWLYSNKANARTINKNNGTPWESIHIHVLFSMNRFSKKIELFFGKNCYDIENKLKHTVFGRQFIQFWALINKKFTIKRSYDQFEGTW